MLAALIIMIGEAQTLAPPSTPPPVHRLTLHEAERRASAHPAAIIGDQAALAAEARAGESRAALLPQVSLSGSYRYATGNRAIRIGTPPLPPTTRRAPPSSRIYDYLNTSVTATQLLYDFGQSTSVWQAARAAADGASLDARAVRQALLLDVRLAFFAALARRELFEVAIEDLANQQRHLAQVKELIALQLRPPIDLAQARAGTGAAELRRIAAENDLALAKVELCRAMGEPFAEDLDVVGEDLPPVAGEESTSHVLVTEAARARPELASSDRQVDAAERALAGARGGFGPALHLALGVTDVGPMFDPGPFDGTNLRWNYSAALVLNWPLFEGGRTRARVREAESLRAQASAHRRSLEVDVSVEVERARRSVAAAKASVAVSELTLESARERLHLADGRYRAGVGTALELSDAQLGQTTAAAQRVQARYDLATARAQLLHAIGDTR